MKKKLIFLVLISFLVGGVVSAAGLWGTFKGNPVIRITVNGVPTKVTDVPAISYSGRTMVPLYMLKQAGIDYKWDQKNQTIDIIKPTEEPDIPVDVPPAKLTAKDIYKQSVDAVGYVEARDWNGAVICSGSGVMVMPGYFITNHHVSYCGNTGRINVKIAGKSYSNGDKGWMYFDNKDIDLYAASISTSYDSSGNSNGEYPPTGFNIVKTDLPQVGDKVYAIGSPLGLENTVSEGIVSGIRTENGVTLIQHTCNTTHGSSGGALMDEEGYLIGITSAGFDGTNLNFAIPISYVKDEIDKLNKK